MADEPLRERALLIAVRIVELSWPDRCRSVLSDGDCDDEGAEDDILSEVLFVAEQILRWLPPPAVRLRLTVGPVTEQPS